MSSMEIIERADKVLMNTYPRSKAVFVRGEGLQLWDAEGKRYLDFLAGIAVCNLGHAHPAVTAAVREQAASLVHVSNLFYTEPMVELAERLVARSFADRVFFCNSGAEANEGAVKLARKYFKAKGQPDRYKIVTMEGSFHGRTMAMITATGQAKVKAGFEPLLPGFSHVPFNDLAALRAAVDAQTAAVMLEPILGEGGVVLPDSGYLEAVKALCRDRGMLLIFDEIQSGLGRTGELFAYELSGVAPDIMTLAKGLANGLPLGAFLATEEVASAFTPGSHGTTFGAGPVICRAGLAVIEELTRPGFLEGVRARGVYFLKRLNDLKAKHPCVDFARGVGLFLALGLKVAGGEAVRQCLEKGFVINCTQDKILRFVPPLIVTEAQVDELVACLDEILASLDQQP